MEGGRGERCCELKKRLAGRRFSIFRGLCISSFFHFPISSEVWTPRPHSLSPPQQPEVILGRCGSCRVACSLSWAKLILNRAKQLPVLSRHLPQGKWFSRGKRKCLPRLAHYSSLYFATPTKGTMLGVQLLLSTSVDQVRNAVNVGIIQTRSSRLDLARVCSLRNHVGLYLVHFRSVLLPYVTYTGWLDWLRLRGLLRVSCCHTGNRRPRMRKSYHDNVRHRHDQLPLAITNS